MRRISSKSEYAKKHFKYCSKHIYDYKYDLFKIYGIEPSAPLKFKNGVISKGFEHTILGWTDDKVLKDEEGNYLDLVIHDFEGKEIWEPFVEFLLKEQVMKKGISEIDFGYIAGLEVSQTRDFTPYKIWITIK